MALLIVQAQSEDTIAAPGNRNTNYIVVSVTDSAGQPVTGLTASNFAIQPNIVGPGGALVNITTAITGHISGTYIVDVVPILTYTWKAGVYIFAVQVTRGSDHGRHCAAFKWINRRVVASTVYCCFRCTEGHLKFFDKTLFAKGK